jgi:hypothetical protein
MVSADIGIWVGALFTIFIYTYFASERQNPFYRFAQSTVVGCALGYIIVIVMAKTIDSLVIAKISAGSFIWIVPFLIGLLIYTRLVPGIQYMARTPVAIIVSVGLGLGARASMDAQLWRFVTGAADLVVSGVSGFEAMNNIIIVVGMIAAVYYFYFTMSPGLESSTKPFALFGRYILLLYFGQRFGGTIMFRLTLFIGRLQYLLYDWLQIGAGAI